MKNIFTFLIFCIIVAGTVAAAQPSKKFITSSISIYPDSVTPGGSGEIRISLLPKEGIHINTEPSIEFIPDKQNIAGMQPMKKVIPIETNGYFDPSQPIVIPFTIPHKSTRGKSDVKGIVRYFICSDAEGWCRRFQDEFSVPLMIK